MPNPTQRTMRHYAPPFVEQSFYLLPLPWLHAVVDASALDARELLLAQVVDGQVIFAEEQGEQTWHEAGEAGRPFFTRRTYEQQRKSLLAQDLLRKYRPAPCPPDVTKTAWHDLQRGIKYTVATWPAESWVYRPRTYLTERWPVWLGNSDAVSRLIVLALLAEANRLHPAASTDLLPAVTLSWRQICTFVEQCLGNALSRTMVKPVTALVRKGLQELAVLNAVRASEDNSLDYVLTLNVFDQKPQWSIPAMAQHCAANVAQDGPCLEVVRDLMTHCWEPVTRLKRVWHAVQASRASAALLDETDLLDLQKFLRTQRHQTPPQHHDHVLEAFLRQRQPTGTRFISGLFWLAAQEVTVAKLTTEGNPICMPVTSVHGIAATQFWIRCERNDGLTVPEAQAILATTRWLIWQEPAAGAVLEELPAPPVVIPLVSHPPRALSIDFGYTLRANILHTQLDYARPFEVILRCQRPDPRLRLHCRFRLLFTAR